MIEDLTFYLIRLIMIECLKYKIEILKSYHNSIMETIYRIDYLIFDILFNDYC